jgi:hypothetical protein
VIKFRRLTRLFQLNPLAQYWHDLFNPAALDSSQAGTKLRQQLRPTAAIPCAVEGPVPQLPALQRCQYTPARKLAIVPETIDAMVSASMVVRRHALMCVDDLDRGARFGMHAMDPQLLA